MTRLKPDAIKKVVVIGPGPTQVGGVATFIEILLTSHYMNARYRLIHLDTTRGPHGAGLASKFAIINLLYFIRQVANFLVILIKYKPHLLHIPITSYWAFWKDTAFIIIARLFGLKVVAHLHGGMFHKFYNQRNYRIQRFIGWVLDQANIIVALSSSWKQFLLEEVDSNLQVEIIPNTIDTLFAKRIVSTHDTPQNKKDSVLYVGTLSQHKGVYDILNAIPLVLNLRPATKFVFAGLPESPDEWTMINQICNETNLNGSVDFKGLVKGGDKLDLYLQSTLFLLPSYGENMPYALLEAMAAGLPVITTSVGAIPEIVEDGLNGFLIQPGDYQALAGKICQLLSDPSLQTIMRNANIEKIRKDYLPEIAMARFDAIYCRLLSGS